MIKLTRKAPDAFYANIDLPFFAPCSARAKSAPRAHSKAFAPLTPAGLRALTVGPRSKLLWALKVAGG